MRAIVFYWKTAIKYLSYIFDMGYFQEKMSLSILRKVSILSGTTQLFAYIQTPEFIIESFDSNFQNSNLEYASIS